MGFSSIAKLIKKSEDDKKEIWQLIMEDEANETGTSTEKVYSTMEKMWLAMKKSSESYDPKLRSSSGLSGGNGKKIYDYRNKAVSGEFIAYVMSEAISVAESNACMRCIVAAPTAGSCGVIPAVLMPYVIKNNTDDETVIKALFHASAFGQVIAERAFISGAEGGCQAEIGSASAMAAAMLVYLQGGSNKKSAHALAIALKSLLGLVCDPVAGLVEVPCIKRNVIGAVNAITACDMAMAGIESMIPADEVIDAMREVGEALPKALRETSLGGLAATPTGISINERLMPKVD